VVEIQDARGWDRMISSQPRYNLVDRHVEEGHIAFCRDHGIGMIVYSPLAQGVLSGKYKPGAAAPEGTRAAARPDDMWGYTDDDVLERVQQLRPIADGLGISMAQLALAWALREPNLASVIVGASRPGQVADNAAASGIELDGETLSRIDAILAG